VKKNKTIKGIFSWVDTYSDILSDNPRNPHSRTNRPDQKLVSSMKDNGWIACYPIIVSKLDGLIGDGHRRLVAARASNIPDVTVAYDLKHTADEIFSYNSMSQGITSKHWAEYVLQGGETRGIKNEYARHCIEYIIRKGRMQLLSDIVLKYRKAPNVAKTAQIFAKHMGWDFVKSCIWIAKHPHQNLLNAYRDNIMTDIANTKSRNYRVLNECFNKDVRVVPRSGAKL
jgi:hypothetical protein